ncbi:hypothetical protein [Clostridium thermarum]|nr:hypothetical protein [Clostridium thermarum]
MKKCINSFIAGQIFNNIGSPYLDLGDFDKSLKYYKIKKIIPRC